MNADHGELDDPGTFVGRHRMRVALVDSKGSPIMVEDKTLPILLVDDYQTMVRILRNLLKQIGYENVDEAPNGRVALDMIQAKTYGLIISDWNMEPMTGIELLQKVRAVQGPASTTPFIMVTAESKADNVAAARKAGVDNYLVKPFNAQALRAKIESIRKAA